MASINAGRTRMPTNCVVCHHAVFYKTKTDIVEFSLTALVELKPSSTLDNWRSFLKCNGYFLHYRTEILRVITSVFPGLWKAWLHIFGGVFGSILPWKCLIFWFKKVYVKMALDCDTSSWGTIANTQCQISKCFIETLEWLHTLPSARIIKKRLAKTMHFLSQSVSNSVRTDSAM